MSTSRKLTIHFYYRSAKEVPHKIDYQGKLDDEGVRTWFMRMFPCGILKKIEDHTAPVVQQAEHPTTNRGDAGSSPVMGPTHLPDGQTMWLNDDTPIKDE
jgi:hypothetical protein